MLVEQPTNPFVSEADKERLANAARALGNDPNWLIVREYLIFQVDMLEFEFWKENVVRSGYTLDQVSDVQARHAAFALAATLPQHILEENGVAEEAAVKSADPYDGEAIDLSPKPEQDPY